MGREEAATVATRTGGRPADKRHNALLGGYDDEGATIASLSDDIDA